MNEKIETVLQQMSERPNVWNIIQKLTRENSALPV